MNYKQFIKDFKINKSWLAEKMDMPQGTFSNKFSDNIVYAFSIDELGKMKKILLELATAFSTVEFYDSITIKTTEQKKAFVNYLTSDMKTEDFTKELKKVSKTDKRLPGLTAGFKAVKVSDIPKPLSRTEAMKNLRK